MDAISQPLDWLGVNYYTRSHYQHAADTPWPSYQMVEGPLPKTDMNWEIRPEGLSEFLIWLSEGPAKGLPLYVTENGMAEDDHLENGAVNDPVRMSFIDGHLNAARTAVDAGVDLRGFFYWSLLDNYEWAFGYDKRFGLVHVDYTTQTRTPKASFHALAEALKR
jgi:beta-glucosidase